MSKQRAKALVGTVLAIASVHTPHAGDFEPVMQAARKPHDDDITDDAPEQAEVFVQPSEQAPQREQLPPGSRVMDTSVHDADSHQAAMQSVSGMHNSPLVLILDQGDAGPDTIAPQREP